jgi:hypothetical protein
MWSLTALYGQTGNITDTLTCYTTDELRRIATKVVYANECDTLYSLTEQQLTVKDSIIGVKEEQIILRDSTIESYKDIVELKDSMLYVKQKALVIMHEHIQKQETKLKLTKLGWVSSLIAGLVLVLL